MATTTAYRVETAAVVAAARMLGEEGWKPTAAEALEIVRRMGIENMNGGDTIVAGDVAPPVVDTPLGRLGLTICFDLRFSWLYGDLRARGAELITVPSAFTARTGKDHWHILLRARAIETQSWVMAPAQVGRHDDQGLRESYGHALIVDPWGTVAADAGDPPGIAVAEIDLNRLREVRQAIPMQRPLARE